MNKLPYLIIAVCFFACGYMSHKVIAMREIVELQKEQSARYKTVLQDNYQLSESYTQLNQQYDNVLKEKENAINKQKELINANNRITKQLVRYIQAESSGELQRGDPTATFNPNATIPADQFAGWAAGLVTHDNQCVNQLNTLIEVINNADK